MRPFLADVLRLPLLLVLLLQGAALKGASKASWVEVKSPHFVAYTDAGEVTARELLQRFEVMRQLLRPAFPEVPTNPPRPVVLVIHRDRSSMKDFTPGLFEKADIFQLGGVFLTSPKHRFALIPTDSGGSVQRHSRVIFHRYAHSIIGQGFPDLPPWLEEGLASFYGLTEFRDDKVLVGQAPPGFLKGLKAHASTLMTLDALLALPWGTLRGWSYDQSITFQALSWALVHYLYVDPEARKAGLFDAYLKALRGPGKEAQAAARASLGDLVKLQAALNLYLRQLTHAYWTYPLPVRLVEKDVQVRPLDEAEFLALRNECLQASADWQDPCPLPKPWK